MKVGKRKDNAEALRTLRFAEKRKRTFDHRGHRGEPERTQDRQDWADTMS
jgi:hypothetical protein